MSLVNSFRAAKEVGVPNGAAGGRDPKGCRQLAPQPLEAANLGCESWPFGRDFVTPTPLPTLWGGFKRKPKGTPPPLGTPLFEHTNL